MSEQKKPKLCLIDASGYIHRAYHALPPLTTSKGQPVNAIYGFSRMVSKLLKTEKPDFLGLCFDTPKPTFRHEQYADYKGTRKEIDEALISQLPLVEELAHVSGFPCFKKEGFEADDVIATLAEWGLKKNWDVLILSGDKDILQLVSPEIRVRDEIKKVDYDRDRVKERHGVYPEQLVDYFSLMGDKVDNVIGVPGVGEKTASKLIADHGSLEGLYRNLSREKPALQEKLTAYHDQVLKNRELVRLVKDVPLTVNETVMTCQKIEESKLKEFVTKLEFKGEIFGTEVPETSNLTVNTERQVKIILTEKELDALVAEARTAPILSYDLETTSLNERTCDIVGIAISVKEKFSAYIPLGHHYLGSPQQLPWPLVREKLKPLFVANSILKVGQNIKFDNAILDRFGIRVQGPFFDTMIAAYCLDPSRSGFGLKDLAADFFGEKMTRFDELMKSSKEETIDYVAVEQAAPYAGADSEVVLRLVKLFQQKLTETKLDDLFNSLEMPLVEVLERMEKTGIRIDADYLQQLGKKFETRKKQLEQEIFTLAGEEFSVNSPKQLAHILFEKLKMPAGRKTKTGFSTGEDVLSRLAPQYPICEKIINYREMAKLISTYIEGLLALVDKKTNRVHTSFNQTGTMTGRLSSTDPNLQNIPIRSDVGREIRKAFIASPGCQLLSADYSQIDLRALAHMSEDPVLIETFRSGGDIHASTAAQVFHVELSDVTAEMRRRAKAINFGIVYGQQAWGLSQGLGIELKEAQEFINKYFERYAGVRAWIENTLAQARKDGAVTTLSGRRRKINDINSSNAQVRGFAERIAINTPIQGTSADIIKVAMIHLHAALEKNNLKTEMMVQVHDELLFDVPDQEMETIAALVKSKMEGAYSLRVPLVVDLKVGRNWNDMEKRTSAVTA